MDMSLRRFALPLVLGIALSVRGRAQCLEWDARFAAPGANATVHALAVFDDGSGPALYAAGEFTVAGDVSAARIVRWNGVSWSPLGSGISGPVYALAVFDDGSGPALFAGGNFTMAGGASASRIAKWNGITWSSVASGMDFGIVFTLAVHNDGSGAALYAGGVFTAAGGTSAPSIAKWNGSSWAGVGGGVFGTVYALTSFNDGSGPALFVGGQFTLAGGNNMPNLARWNGSSWSQVGTGVESGPGTGVSASRVFDDGSGPALFAGGTFLTAGGITVNHIAKWNGAAWSALDDGVNDSVLALLVHDDGSGPALYAGGEFTAAGTVAASRVAKWQRTQWTALDGGTDDAVRAFAVYNDGVANALYAGGSFRTAGAVRANRVAKWVPSTWSALDEREGLADRVNALTTFDAGSGTELYAGGKFTFAGKDDANHVARWDGAEWSRLAGGVDDEVYALSVFDDGGGEALYAGGVFAFAGGASASRIAHWNGSNWAALAGGVSGGPVYALTVFGSGPGTALYAGGGFVNADGMSANRIAKWNGTSWTALGVGLQGGGAQSSVRALCVFNDGSGLALYVGGIFVTAGGVTSNNVAKWNGTSWTALAGGTDGAVRALAVFNDGSGPALYAGGDFTTAGAVSAFHVARWNGTAWSVVGRGTDDNVNALAVFSDGARTALYAGGDFTVAGGENTSHIARWDGTLWTELDTGLGGAAGATVSALTVFEDGSDLDADLYVGGLFTTAGGKASAYIAEWHGCAPGNPYCFGDGLDPLVTAACPCGNVGAPGHGCANSNQALGGARLSASGSTIPNTIVLTCIGIPNNALCTFLRASQSNAAGTVFGDGIKCLQGAAFRFGSQNAGQGGNSANSVSIDPSSIASGNTRYYQLYYRNPNLGFCTPELFNVSNGYTLVW